MKQLADQVALITGGSRGIGRAIAEAFGREGARIAVAARTVTDLQETADALRHQHAQVQTVAVDVTDPRAVEGMVSSVERTLGPISILVNAAGVQMPIGRVIETDPDAWLEAIRINLGGVYLCCRAVLPTMLDHRRGNIINLSGGGATKAFPHFSAYSASKAAVVRFTETLAEEVHESGVSVNAIAPGAVYTALTERLLAAGEQAAGPVAYAEALRTKETGGTPLEKITDLAVFLASPISDGITGRLISAVWDDWRSFPRQRETIAHSDLYTLRRIDGRPS